MSDQVKPMAASSASSIDWEVIHRRLERMEEALGRGTTADAAGQKKILHERARKLAAERKAEREQDSMEVVEFFLGNERYALASSHVREVHALKDITPLPGTPSFIVGIVNVRGQIVSVVNLGRFFDLPAKGLSELNKVIIIRDESMEFGLLADVAIGVRRIPLEYIQPPLPTLTGKRAEYLKGVTADRVVVLDAGKLLADPALKISQSSET
jgi:purine-binding chemotaxis protein CheW